MSNLSKAILDNIKVAFSYAPKINFEKFIPASMPPEIVAIYLRRTPKEREIMFHDWLMISASNDNS